MTKIRWGILGCGRIAGKFADDCKLVNDGTIIAAGARSTEAAAAFAGKYGIPHVHGSYESLVSDPDVDIIYVATPHGLHYEHVMLCLEAGKAVLCEKAFAINHRQASEMIRKARSKKLFLMEALWSKFLPHYQLLTHYLRDGKLGEMQNVLINFGFSPPSPAPQRMFDPALGGGSLLDIGIYNLFFAMTALGKPDQIDAVMKPAHTGVDEQMAITLKYNNGALAQLFSSFSSNLATEADFSGTQGRIRLSTRFYEPSTQFEYYPGRVDSKQLIPFEKEAGGWGYQYEIRHAQECLRNGLTESPVMSHEDTLTLMEVMDEVRRKAGLEYAADK